MGRTKGVDRNGMKKGPWSPDEDEMLRAYVQKYGHWNWRQLPKYAGLSRCGKSCRLRWMNYLCPSVKRGSYTKEQEDIIVKLHQKFGNRWSAIARKLPGRTDNAIKNHWHTTLKKRLLSEAKEKAVDITKSDVDDGQPQPISGTEPSLNKPCSSDQFSSSTCDFAVLEEKMNRIGEDRIGSLDWSRDLSNGSFWTHPFPDDAMQGYRSERGLVEEEILPRRDEVDDMFYHFLQDFQKF